MSTSIDIKKRIAAYEEGSQISSDISGIDITGDGASASMTGDKMVIDIPGSIGNTVYYMNETVTQAPYKEFSSIGTAAAEQAVPATVAGGATATIAAYQTPPGIPGSIIIPQGLWQLFLHFNATTVGQNWIIRPLVYKRDLGGIETLIFTIDPIIVTNMSTVTTLYTTESVIPNTALLATDRIVVKIDVENTTGVSQTANFITEGPQHYSVATTTLNQAVPTGAVISVTGTAPVVSSGGTTPAISIPQATALVDGYLDSADFALFNGKQDPITLTTLTSSGAATFIANVLNIPNYTLSGLGGVPTTRTLTINGVSFDLSADRSWTVGTVTSVQLAAGTGISLAGTNPITSSGTITVTNSAPDQTVVLNAGTGIGVTGTYPNFTISNTDPTTGVTLASAGGTETLVNDGTGPSLATKGITAGTGISLSSTATDLTVTNAAPDQIVALTAGSGINVTGTYPNFTIDNTGALSDVNIYNSDGTLSADRTVAMNNFGLTFNGAGGSNGSQINISSAANRAKGLNFQVGSGLRWKQQVSGAEIGGDLGSQLAMSYYDDAGVIKGTAFSISRTNGAFRLNNAYSLPTSGGTTGQVLTSTTLGLTEFQALPAEIQAAASDETTNLTIGTSKVTFRMPHAMTLTAVRASLTTAQTAGALLTVDINLNGVSVLGTKLTFDNNERTTVTAATPATIVTSALTDDGEITVDIDAVGTAGARGLKITLIGTRA